MVLIEESSKSGEISKDLARLVLYQFMYIAEINIPDIQILDYENYDGTVSKTKKGNKCILKLIFVYKKHKEKNGRIFKINDWMALKQDEFDKFRIVYNPYEYLPISNNITTYTPPSVNNRSPYQPNLINYFKRGKKRDATLFLVLKETNKWYKWYI